MASGHGDLVIAFAEPFSPISAGVGHSATGADRRMAMDTLRQPRIAAYLAFVGLVLLGLAVVGPGWFIAGLCGFTAIEIGTSMREAEMRRQLAAALARPNRH